MGSELYVTLDFWQTLILDLPESDAKRSEMRCQSICGVLSDAGVDVSSQDMKRAYDLSARKFQENWMRNVDVSTDYQIRIIIELACPTAVTVLRDTGVMRALRNAYIDPLFHLPPPLNRDTIPTLEGLRVRVKKIGLISNTGRVPGSAIREFLERQGILQFFDATIFSDEVGYRKPDDRIFHEAAKRLDVDEANGIHIGDNPETDVWGAKRAGMRAVLFEYNLPEGFNKMPDSTITLSRTRLIPDSDIRPDARISALTEAIQFVDSLRLQ